MGVANYASHPLSLRLSLTSEFPLEVDLLEPVEVHVIQVILHIL